MITNFVLCYFFMPNPKFRNLNFKWKRKQIDKIKELFKIYPAPHIRRAVYISKLIRPGESVGSDIFYFALRTPFIIFVHYKSKTIP